MIHDIKATKRELIINSAARVFARKGFHRAKMEDIANDAGIGKSTIYEYFSSKKNLFDDMIMYGMDMLVEEIQNNLSRCDDARSKLRNLLLLFYSFVINHRDMANLLVRNSPSISEDTKNMLISTKLSMHNIIKDIIQQGIDEGVFRPADTGLVSTVFEGLMAQLNVYIMFGVENINIEDIDKILDIFYHGTVKKTVG